jgi:hypothetical protein
MPVDGIRHLPIAQAFDAVMTHKPIAEVQVSPFRINFGELRERSGVLASKAQIDDYYRQLGNLTVSDSIILACYYYNIVQGLVGLEGCRAVLEIGAGNGNLASIIVGRKPDLHYLIVDLPETLLLSMPFLRHLFPQSSFTMPHEIGDEILPSPGFHFITPNQLTRISSTTYDIGINTMSFQEMRASQIAEYFSLLQRAIRKGGHFFAHNRVEKIPAGEGSFDAGTAEPPIRFSEYPWCHNNEVLVYEVCRLMRLVSIDSCFLRLERIA